MEAETIVLQRLKRKIVISKRFDSENLLRTHEPIARALESPASRYAQALQSLPALQLAKEFQDSTIMRAARDLLNSPAMQVSRELANSAGMLGIQELQNRASGQAALALQNVVMKDSIFELQNFTSLQRYLDLHDSSTTRILQALQGESVLARAKELQDSSIASALRGMELKSLIPALTGLTGTPFDPELINEAVTLAHRAGYGYETTDDLLRAEFATVAAEINSSGNEVLDFRSLSESARKVVLWLFYFIVLPFLVNAAATIALEWFNNKTAATAEITTSREAKRLARCDNALEREIFAGCRVVTGMGLRLRTEPGMKSEVITTLPLGKLIVVLDSSERAWLHVEVDLDGDLIEGWVARRYTTSFK